MNDKIGEVLRQVRQIAANKSCEMFLHESPDNKYVPVPPEGWIALRSGRRRLFIRRPAVIGPTAYGDALQAALKNGEFQEHPLR